MPVRGVRSVFLFMIFALLCLSRSILAQGTAFTYQGKLSDSGNPANGNYDLQFKLFDTATVGTGAQQGSTVTVSNVTVTNGIFTINLDFGACPSCFDGSSRFLEVAAKPTIGSTFTTLTPRQPITSTPYAINAAKLGGLAASSFIQNTTTAQAMTNFNISGDGTAGGTLTGSIVNAMQQVNINGLRAFTVNGAFNNGTTIFTASNTFAGDGAGVNTTPSTTLNNPSGKFNAFFGAGAGQANTTGNSNSFFGYQAGAPNTTGQDNSFFGSQAGTANTTGSSNSFFGSLAGQLNTTGNNNAFFGKSAGFSNTTGQENAFFGVAAGTLNTTGNNNAFFGTQAGEGNTTGTYNSFFGTQAGFNNNTGDQNAFFGFSAGDANTTGNGNAFFGKFAGLSNTTGNFNTFIGNSADFNISNPTGGANTLLGFFTKVNSDVSNATAIGANATVTQSNSLVLGAITGVNGAITDTKVGIGTTAPATKLDIQRGNVAINNNLLQLRSASDLNHGILYSASVDGPEFRAFGGFRWTNGTAGASERMRLDANGNLGIGTTAPAFKLHVNGELRSDMVSVGTYVSGGTIQVCVNTANNRLAVCNSSLRYKTAVQPFTAGLTIVNRLQPIRYRWKESGLPDIGLAAEAVEKVEPLLTFSNDKGQVEGVKYNQLSAVFINAIKEQQAQIREQQEEIATLRQELRQIKHQKELIQKQQQEMATIKQLLCASHPKASICKAKSLQ